MEQKTRLANKDKKTEIMLCDALNYHFRCTRITVRPGNEQFPTKLSTVRQFKKEVLDKLPETWPHLSNYQEAILVHDPTLLTPEEKAEAEAELFKILHPTPAASPGSMEERLQKQATEIRKLKRRTGLKL